MRLQLIRSNILSQQQCVMLNWSILIHFIWKKVTFYTICDRNIKSERKFCALDSEVFCEKFI